MLVIVVAGVIVIATLSFNEQGFKPYKQWAWVIVNEMSLSKRIWVHSSSRLKYLSGTIYSREAGLRWSPELCHPPFSSNVASRCKSRC